MTIFSTDLERRAVPRQQAGHPVQSKNSLITRLSQLVAEQQAGRERKKTPGCSLANWIAQEIWDVSPKKNTTWQIAVD